MSTRVYILLDVVEGKAEEATNILLGNPGVKLVDILEGRPNVIAELQARSRRQLAELTNRVLALVEGVTEGFLMLPTVNGHGTNLHTGCYKARRHHGEHYLEATNAKEGRYGGA